VEPTAATGNIDDKTAAARQLDGAARPLLAILRMCLYQFASAD
jgi:hypothetical protein